jgi:hypothetical protein
MYRIIVLMKFETDIIAMSCDMYMFVKTFKTDIIVFIGNEVSDDTIDVYYHKVSDIMIDV